MQVPNNPNNPNNLLQQSTARKVVDKVCIFFFCAGVVALLFWCGITSSTASKLPMTERVTNAERVCREYVQSKIQGDEWKFTPLEPPTVVDTVKTLLIKENAKMTWRNTCWQVVYACKANDNRPFNTWSVVDVNLPVLSKCEK